MAARLADSGLPIFVPIGTPVNTGLVSPRPSCVDVSVAVPARTNERVLDHGADGARMISR